GVELIEDGQAEGFEMMCIELRHPSAGSVLGDSRTVCVRIGDVDDLDGDRLADPWEVRFFGATDVTAGEDDPDGDGSNNIRESEDGTDPTSSASVRYRISVGGTGGYYVVVPDRASYEPGEFVAVVAVADPSFEFLRWEASGIGVIDRLVNPVSMVMGSDISLSAVMLTPIDLALDGSGLDWASGGAIPWLGQTSVSHDGVDAAESGAVDPGGVSELTSTVQGPGLLTFWWKTDGGGAASTLRLLVGGVPTSSLSGDSDWVYQSVFVPAGESVLRWVFTRGGSVDPSRSWVDEVRFLPQAGDSYRPWQERWFSAEEIEDTTVSEPGADPNGDGYSNLFHYLLGGDPVGVSAGLDPAIRFVPAVSGESVRIEFEVISARLPYVRLGLDTSDDGARWERSSAQAIVLGDEGAMQSLGFQTPRLGTPRFYRIVVELVP
ncbi:MAG: hypothetical protein P8J87_10530, partial [Verrucomicrobiales bacterium]|nr:hypothetical protein [Verrucomicrobiales bacterium]